MMADVENLATSTVATDIPISSDVGVEATSEVAIETNAANDDASASGEYGASPPQERSSNSHRTHDSEYDTADTDSDCCDEYPPKRDEDLEDDDLDDDDDLTDEDDIDEEDDDDGEEEEEEDDDDDDEIEDDDAGSHEKISEAEIQKKVDEDRSNPQYIPKRGTFYEHDDRMADGDNDGVIAIGDPIGVENCGSNTAGNSKPSTQAPSISQASKTMKKWQPASGVERWSHDRFDESEQQPKSRSELISAYGYDIRTEDAPPRARRRRRYARGPTKYSRKWEDEGAYVKMANKERKPPRPSDFPPLNERPQRKQRREPRESNLDEISRDEKENQPERRRPPISKSTVNERLNIAAGRVNMSFEEPRDREDVRARISGRPKIGMRHTAASSGRQPAMEFKPKARNNKHQNQHQQQQHQQQHQQSNNIQNNMQRSDDRTYERPPTHRPNHQYQQQSTNQNNSINEQYQQQNISMKGAQSSPPHMKQQQQQQQQQQQYHGDGYTNQGSKYNDQHGSYIPKQQQMQLGTQQHHSQQQQQPSLTHLRQSSMTKSPTPSTLSQRLQQVQHRNDPSHVGSVQMHALATQNQQKQQQQQQQQHVIGQQQNAMMMSTVAQQQQHQQQLLPTQPPEQQRGPPKRYSSMRRSQHDGQQQHLAEPPHSHQQQQQQQQTMQQLHMQQPPPNAQQGPQGPLIMQDQHSILQANLLQQLYHQENIQAQMQALQVSQPPTQKSKPTTYGTVPATSAPTVQSQAYGANPANNAYYVTDGYVTGAGQNPQAPPTQQTPPYAPQPSGFLAPTAAYNNPPPSQPAQSGPPSGVYAGGPPPAAVSTVPPTGQNSNQNYSNYQNYNTVGGTTYFVPPAPTTSRPVVLPQRRPTNAIPILPPSEKNKQQQRGNDTSKDDTTKSIGNSNSTTATSVGSAENIDHIIDNMFVQRPVFQPPPSQANVAAVSSPSNSDAIAIDAQTSKSLNVDDVIAVTATVTNIASNPVETINGSSNTKSIEESTPTANVASTPIIENSSSNNSTTVQE